MLNNENKTILLTGCSTGIGQCLAFGMHNAGYTVIATCRSQEDTLQFKNKGIQSFVIDLNSSKSIFNGVDTANQISGGRIYGLINNGAYGQPGAVEDLSRNALRDQFETNVFGTQELTNSILPIMRQHNEGRVIQISSILGFICLKFRGAYNASKYALEALTDTMRLELADTNIKFSLIEPGPITSEFRANALKKFKTHINEEKSLYKNQYQAVENRLISDKPAQFNLPAEAVLRVALKVLASSNPKVRYPVTTPTRIMAPMKRLLPDRLMDRLLLKLGG